ncbi:MAG: AAA family ATPase [Verrucomicrobiales bacterium]
MILERLVFENFRQFKGRQELVLSSLPDQNVTIVHAENGFGKTTILKGLLWVLYGRDGLMGTDGQPDDFEKPDRLINEVVAAQTSDPNQVDTSVELTFKHDGDRYILRRSLTLAQQKLNPKQTDLSLMTIRDGETFRRDNPQRRIQAIIPDGIRRLLFFNGERINYLAMERSSEEVSSAIRKMLGLELLEKTIADLNHANVKGKLRQEQKAQPSSEEMASLLASQDSVEGQIKEFEEAMKQIQRNLVAIDEQVAAIDASLEANKEARELAMKRARLKKEIEELRTRKGEISKKLAKLIAEDGYMLFTTELVSRGQETVGRLRAEGKIPARVLNSFLEDLLERKQCICTRDLAPGTEFREAVEQLMEIAGDGDFNNAVSALDHAIGVLEEGARKTEERIRELNIERLEMIREIADLEEQEGEISPQIGRESEEARDLEEKRRKLFLDRDSQQAERGRTEGKIEQAREELARVKAEILQMQDLGADAELARRRVTAVEDCSDLLKRILDAETEELRPLLNEEISKHFRKIMDRDFWPELADDFTLRIRKRVAGAVIDSDGCEIDAALSTGQRTVTSLVFIASLVALASRRSKIPTIVRGLSGSDFPIAIDSPFGSLSMFRRDVARYIPELAPQVLLLVSPTQYDGDVHEALESVGRVGKRYYLSFTGRTIREDANPELIIGGETIRQYFHSDDEEFTTICEL